MELLTINITTVRLNFIFDSGNTGCFCQVMFSRSGQNLKSQLLCQHGQILKVLRVNESLKVYTSRATQSADENCLIIFTKIVFLAVMYSVTAYYIL